MHVGATRGASKDSWCKWPYWLAQGKLCVCVGGGARNEFKYQNSGFLPETRNLDKTPILVVLTGYEPNSAKVGGSNPEVECPGSLGGRTAHAWPRAPNVEVGAPVAARMDSFPLNYLIQLAVERRGVLGMSLSTKIREKSPRREISRKHPFW